MTVLSTKDYIDELVSYTIFHLKVKAYTSYSDNSVGIAKKTGENHSFSIKTQLIIIRIMVLIAVDKLNRKVLGYLCRNGSIFTYCCVECDVEFEAANQLETHMLKHELRPQEEEREEIEHQQQQILSPPNDDLPNENAGIEADTTNETSEIDNIPLTQEEIENRLRSEYDLKPCSISLFRFECDIDDLHSDSG